MLEISRCLYNGGNFKQNIRGKLIENVGHLRIFVCFVALCPKSTAMVMAYGQFT